MTRSLLPVLPLLLTLAGCDIVQQQMGIEDPNAKAAKVEAEGKAVGGACRHSGRAIEDCYAIYHWLPKAPVFAGWQEMDAYMRTNKIEAVEPQLPPPAPPGTRRKAAEEPAANAKTEKPAEKKAEK
ncbi:MAG: hypothetical protein HYU78_05305 [Rhodocyclales bacterium]|nr:hypothetical protein [Rhodocyclales bacterium]